jgi:hypothetical protein
MTPKTTIIASQNKNSLSIDHWPSTSRAIDQESAHRLRRVFFWAGITGEPRSISGIHRPAVLVQSDMPPW